MIFHRIYIRNLFTYYGEHIIDLTPLNNNGDGSVVLVMGRNGYGKTNLLRSITLLFLGTDDKSVRRGRARGAYVLGDGASWSGILNTRARDEGDQRCSIRIELGPRDGANFIAERRWNLEGGRFQAENETLEVHADDRVLAGESAETRLNEFLPRELVPFFFFDGEEIQYLAEASDISRAEAMEQLLSLSFINGIEDELGHLIRDWRRADLPGDVQAEISEEEGKLNAVDKHIAADRERQVSFREQISEQKERADELKRRLDKLREIGGLADTSRLDDEISGLEAELQQKQNDLAYAVAADAPLLANGSLVRSAVPVLRSVIDKKTKAVSSIFETLVTTLPKRLFDEPPLPADLLSDSQRRFFSSKLGKILKSYEVADEPDNLLDSIDLVRARQLLEKFQGIEASLKALREDRARRLQEVSRLKARLNDKKAERREAEFGSSEISQQYEQLDAEYADAQQEIGRLAAELNKIDELIVSRRSDRDKISEKIRALEQSATHAEEARRKLTISTTLRETFREYRRTRRQAKREQIEEALNQHFVDLMSGHRMVKRIVVDEEFYLKFLDDQGRDIGHSTISHGMRQLAVTAMLWALKDVSGRPLPIIVDTPLARIDRENQENLLIHYYPKASEQVIVLATDSEIDERKFELVRPHLAKMFVLSNPEGNSTRLDESDLSTLEPVRGAGRAHG